MVRAGRHYSAGSLKTVFLGSNYRDLWTTPITVPILVADTFAGGLTLLQEGGGRQTRSLRFGTGDDQEFVFRSVDKEQSGGLHPDLRETVIDDIIQDQVSAKHPGAALVVAPLLEAAGVLHAEPVLAVMADGGVLEEFRGEFAGMLGMIEARPTETEGVGRFGRYERLIGTERLLERLEESAEDRVDARAFLTARLMDILIGDWDRHDDQWRWAQTDVRHQRIWLPIPRDRDNAFFNAGGVVATLGGAVRPYVIQFDESYPDLLGLTYNSTGLDRRILSELPRSAWDSVVVELQERLTDQTIAAAVRKLPPPYHELSGEELERKLRARRAGLSEVASEFYQQIVGEVDLYATDRPELALVDRRSDGTVLVQISAEEQGIYLQRLFDPAETREIRIHLHGGADSTVIWGSGPGPVALRVLGGGNDDHFEDASAPGAGPTFFYDDLQDEDVFITGPRTVVDTRAFALPTPDTTTQNNPPLPRDWGSSSSYFAPRLEWRSDIGPVVGGGPQWTRYGFRRFPYAHRTSLTLSSAPLEGRFGFTGEFHRIHTGSDGETRLRATVSQVGLTRFQGYGNEVDALPAPDLSRVWATEYSLAAEWIQVLGPSVRALIGPTVTHLDPEPEPGSPAQVRRPPGSRSFTLGGVTAGASYDGRDSRAFPSRGARIEVDTEWYPMVAGDAPEGFVRSGITAFVYRRLPLPLEPLLAVRGGGETLWGESPFQYAPSIGGRSSLRGYHTGEFVGDASLFGSVELRAVLGRIDLLLTRGDFGTIALADVGRVFLNEEQSSRWHSAVGGGLWFGPVGREFTGHVLMTRGDHVSLTAGLGLPF